MAHTNDPIDDEQGGFTGSFQDALGGILGGAGAPGAFGAPGASPLASAFGGFQKTEKQLADEATKAATAQTFGATGKQRAFGGPGPGGDIARGTSFNTFKIASGDLAQRLGRTFQSSNIDLRLQQAEDLLRTEGRLDPSIANQERQQVERARQQAAQGQDPSASSFADLAGSSLLQQGANQAQISGVVRRESEARERFSTDLQNILGDLFLQPSLALGAGVRGVQAQPDQGPDKLSSFLGAAGSILGGIDFSGGGGSPNFGSGSVTSNPSIFNT